MLASLFVNLKKYGSLNNYSIVECGQLNTVTPTVKLSQTFEELSQAFYF